VSSLNYQPGRNVANQEYIRTVGGTIGVYHDAGYSHVHDDLFGYYTG
jgi:tRNA A-37 threonylcarbamoyl transferase component Bud32